MKTMRARGQARPQRGLQLAVVIIPKPPTAIGLVFCMQVSDCVSMLCRLHCSQASCQVHIWMKAARERHVSASATYAYPQSTAAV